MNRKAEEASINKSSSKSRGAKAASASSVQELSAWWRHHRSSGRDSLVRLLQTPLQSMLTWMVIAIALALPTGLYLGLQSLQKLGDGWQDSAQMSVFLERGAKPAAVERFQEWLERDTEVSSFDSISPANALAEFQRFSGLGDVLNSLDENPLPTVYVIQPAVTVSSPEQLGVLRQRIEANPLVDNVQLDLGWLRRLHEILSLGERIVVSLAGLLSLGVLLIIGNTMRLAIENRREEIVVTKMVGGTNGFVRRPFLYTGFWYGLGGGLLALFLILFIGLWLSNPVNNLVTLYESEYSLSGMEFDTVLALLVVSGFLGWLGAWIAVSRHLRAIEPR